MAEVKRAAFVAVGTEMLRTERLDTNSGLTLRLLAGSGVGLVEKRTVGDEVDAIALAVRELVPRVDLLIVSGGLGPTADDVTREGVAAGLDLPLQRRADLEDRIAERYRSRGRPIPTIASRMADVLAGAEVLPNPVGAAPGQRVRAGRCSVVLLPGVPAELEAMLRSSIMPSLEAASPVRTRTLRLGGTYESSVEARVSPLYDRFGRENVTILAGRGQVTLVLSAAGPEAEARLDEMEGAFAAAVGRDVFGHGDESLAGVVIEHLRRRGWRLAVAESCTGGLVASRLVTVPGASDTFVGGVVAYSNALKTQLLGVPSEVLAAHGAVSHTVAEAMATGVLRLGAECGAGVTGIAGPTGGTAGKPVGTVHMAVATPGGVRHAHHQFPGNRDLVRELAAGFVLDLLRRALEEV